MTDTAERQIYNAGRSEKAEVKYATELAWAKEHLPDEFPPFVVNAIHAVINAGGKPSTKTVMARLEGTGRAASQRDA
jgi:hypothetical protein